MWSFGNSFGGCSDTLQGTTTQFVFPTEAKVLWKANDQNQPSFRIYILAGQW